MVIKSRILLLIPSIPAFMYRSDQDQVALEWRAIETSIGAAVDVLGKELDPHQSNGKHVSWN
jgi:hypothetical protein